MFKSDYRVCLWHQQAVCCVAETKNTHLPFVLSFQNGRHSSDASYPHPFSTQNEPNLHR